MAENKTKGLPKVSITNSTWAFIVSVILLSSFIVVDVILYRVFGCTVLREARFLGLEALEADTPVFKSEYYWHYCTKYGIIESILFALIHCVGYALKVKKENEDKLCWNLGFLWVAQICLKVLLNVHATAMFMGVLEYSKEFPWQSPTLSEYYGKVVVEFDNSLSTVPEGCFDYVSNSLKTIYFAILVTYILIWFLPAVLRLLSKIRWSTSGIVWIVIGFHFIISVFWIALGTINHSNNPNTLGSLQYSAIVKMTVPISMVIFYLLEHYEATVQETLGDVRSFRYKIQSLTLAGGICLVLMFLGEFGSAVCIMITACFTSLILMDAQDLGIWKSIKSIMLGLLGGVAVLYVEVSALDLELWTLFGRDLHFGSANVLTIVLAIPIVIALAIGVLYCVMTLILHDYAKHRDFNEKGLRKLRKNLHVIACNYRAYLDAKSKRPLKPRRYEQPNVGNPKSVRPFTFTVSLTLSCFTLVVMIFNLYLPLPIGDFNNLPILKSYYMTAGGFSTENDVLTDITSIRVNEVENSKRNTVNSVNIDKVEYQKEDFVEDLKDYVESAEEIESVTLMKPTVVNGGEYNSRVYEQFLSIKLMKTIDRLCYSTTTSELKAVQTTLRERMGFNIDVNYRTYFKSMIKVHHVLLEDVMDNPNYIAAGYLKEGFTIKTPNGEQPEEWFDEAGNLRDVKTISSMNDTIFVYDSFLEENSEEYNLVLKDNTDVNVSKSQPKYSQTCKRSEPETACSDYVLYTLSKLGVGTELLLIFIPYFVLYLCVVSTVGSNHALKLSTAEDCSKSFIQLISLIFAISFIVQTSTIVLGVFGISLFSGLSMPLVAKGKCEMLFNGICMACMLFTLGDSTDGGVRR